MTVWEVLLCCSASIPYKGYSVWVQNSISYHLTGCSWILFPAQQGSNTVPDLYFAGIRSVLPVPALLSAPARDGWPSGVGRRGQSGPPSPAEQGTDQLGPHPAGPKQGRSGERNEVQRRLEITRGSVKNSDKVVVMEQVWGEAGNSSQRVMVRVSPETVTHVSRSPVIHQARWQWWGGSSQVRLGSWAGSGSVVYVARHMDVQGSCSIAQTRVKHDSLSSTAIPAQKAGQPLSLLPAFSWKALQGWPRCLRAGLCHTKLD